MTKSSSERAAIVIATWFGCGFFPFGPGTVGSLAAILIAAALEAWFGFAPQWFGLLGLIAIVPGIWASTITAASVDKKDPGIVVVDEVIGQWITLAGAHTFSFRNWIAALALFRVFDIWKPWPIRRLERLPAGTGIVMDDVLAGVFAALVLAVLGWSNF